MTDLEKYPIGTLLIWKGNFKAIFIITRHDHSEIYKTCLHSEYGFDRVGEETSLSTPSHFHIYPPSDHNM